LKRETRRILCWDIAGGLLLLWIAYIPLDVWADFPEPPRGLGPLFVLIEVVLIVAGVMVGLEPPAEQAARFVALLEQNNAKMEDKIDTAIRRAMMRLAVTRQRSGQPDDQLPVGHPEGARDAACMADMAETLRLGRELEQRNRKNPPPEGV